MARKKPEEQYYKHYFLRWNRSETVRSMNMTARGIYRELMDAQYMSNHGDLPDDPQALRRLIGAESHEWKHFMPYLDTVFPAQGGRRSNPTMALVRKENDVRLQSLKQASALGVEARQSAPDGEPNGVPDGVPHGQPNGVPDGEPHGAPKRKEKNNKLGSNSNIARAPSTPGDSDPDFEGIASIRGESGNSLTKEQLRELHS